MPKTKYAQNNLSGGELAPLLDGRTDIEKYFASVETMRNWLPMVQGGMTRRPGFHFADYPKYNDKICRLVPFEYGITQAYAVEIGHQYMRFFMDGYLIRQITGGDLITNGAFPTDLTGWDDYSESGGEELVLNGGMEDGNPPTGWIASWTPETFERSAVEKYDGNYSAHVIDSTPSYGGFYRYDQTLVNGKKYKFSFRYKIISGSIQGWVTNGDGTGYMVQSGELSTTGSWQYFEGVGINLAPGSAGTIVCRNYSNTIPAEFFIDDVSITECGSVIWESGKAKLDGAVGGIGSIGQDIATVSGTTYLMTFDVATDVLYVRIGTSPEGSEIVYDVRFTTGSKQITFIARGATTYIQFLRKSNGPAYLDNVICKEYAPIEILTSPYTETDLPLLKWAQDTNNLFIVHPSRPTQILTRSSSTVWTLTEMEFEDGPYFEQVVSSKITHTGGEAIGVTIAMVADADTWYSGHVGALWRLGWLDAATPPVMQWGYVKITSVEGLRDCHAIVKKTLPEAGATDAHREGRWSILRGFPCSDTFHENRLIMGGAATSPQTFWGSKHEEWDNHAPGVLDDDPISFTIGASNVNIIHWLASARTLIIGTPGGEFRAAGGNDNPITPSNIDVKNESTNQVADCMPLRIGNAIIYIQRAGQQLLEMKYNFDSDSYEADDLTLYSDHLTKLGIEELVYQRGYNPLVWVRRSDGVLLALTYNQKQLTKGWSQQPMDGIVESMAVIPNPTDRSDDVYIAVKRGTKRLIEYLDPYLNVDSGLSLSSSVAVSEISGLEHLIGVTVDIVGDSAVYPQQVVDANGQIFLARPALTLEIGKHYGSYSKTLRPEIKGETTMGCHRKWSRVFARLFETVGLKINGEEVPFRRSTDLMDEGVTPYTGDKHIVNTGWAEEGKIEMEQDLPLPATVLCIFGDLEINED